MARGYRSMEEVQGVSRRQFVRGVGACTAVLGGMAMGTQGALAEEVAKGTPTPTPVPKLETNLTELLAVPRGPHGLPGPFPGRVVQVTDPASLVGDEVQAAVVKNMVEKGITRLTGASLKDSFGMFFTADDVVGIKVNPVGPPLINTRHELTEAVIRWLVDGGMPAANIVVWDRFEPMMRDAGYTAERYPSVRVEALQTMDYEGNAWRDARGRHVSVDSFDPDAYLFVKGVEGKGVKGYQSDEFYLNQHVFNGERSYFGKLVTRRLTKIINLAAFKNTGSGISMATKNLGYGSLCNTGRLHVPLGFMLNTYVLASPWIRNKLVLNITDGIRAQYDGGPDMNAQFVYPNHSLYFGTDPFAMDAVCHRQIVAKRREMKVTVSTSPRYTEYLKAGEKLGLGIADPARIEHVTVKA